jgi:hypothetical protein
MPAQITDGWLAGNFVRQVRKPGRCHYWRGTVNGGHCRKPLKIGDWYAEGEHTDTDNPWQRDRYCLKCAGPEAIAAVGKIGT